MSTTGKAKETGSRLVTGGGTGCEGLRAKGDAVSFSSDKDVLKVTVMMVARTCEHTKSR